ncbi:MAG: tRNA threonylcarbamoyladenosine dehydratase [Firmicutes bacterium]|nr:tRNA threonylcarbamoyladenosine dehydratase [Bacillota bacterium]
MDPRFTRTVMLIGEEGLAALSRASVLVCGLGGVGSYLAEALARSGIGRIGLVDYDRVEITNLNRQLPALTSTLGQLKTDVVAERLADINPALVVEKLPLMVSQETITEILAGNWGYVADAIDDVEAKILLIQECLERKIPIISSMGAGNKLDPTRVQTTDISKTHGCPLAKVIRRRLRQLGIVSGVKTVFSPEQPLQTKAPGSTPASMAFVPGTFGLTMAAEITRDLLSGYGQEGKS